MVKKLSLLLIIASSLLTGCSMNDKHVEISQIIYTVDSGPVLPELQMYEEYTITPDGVKLARNGKTSSTKVYEGEWNFLSDEKYLSELFELAGSKNCGQFERIDPAIVPDGGEIITIILVALDGEKCELVYDPGTTYKNADDLLQKIEQVLDNLKVPAGGDIK